MRPMRAFFSSGEAVQRQEAWRTYGVYRVSKLVFLGVLPQLVRADRVRDGAEEVRHLYQGSIKARLRLYEGSMKALLRLF